ncbi:sulfatase-like hydrolase/transferase [Azorhizophilus paspali]|uniref:Sulfatase-like hydrolase/transferase n=1 Tax=Azorhizophilus paspali TaxID=69963 RepID=A0ABV6SR82_AZOPA
MAIFLKELLLGLYLLIQHDYYRERLMALQGGVPLVLFAGMFAVLLVALWLTAHIRSAPVRYLFALLFFASTLFFDVYTQVSAEYLTYGTFVSLIYSGGFIDEALYQYWASILVCAAKALPLLFGIALAPRRRLPLPGIALVAAPLCALLLLTGILFVRGGVGARGLPAMYTPLAYLNLFAYEAASSTVGPREAVSLPRHGQAIGNDIVLIIDESVSGNYLDINVEHGVRTNLGQSPPGATLYNYGYAAAIANCSADTNVTLRYGGTRSDYLRINSTMPSIWQYARKAGLRTVYIDAQRTGGRLQNLMSKSERKEIDEFVQFDGTPVRDRDMAAAQKLIELLGNDTAELIYLNKIGAHFPVHDKYPDDFMIYRPALPRGQYADISDTGERDGFGGQAEDWGRYRNAYRNTLLWNVGEFFARLFARARLDNAVLIYTSDHGQDLHERGNPGLDTHCGGDPVVEEGLVPLVVIQGHGLHGLDWQGELASNRNRSSHYNIFPTLLQLMGYDLTALQAVYGKPLSLHTEDEFTFNTRFNARLGEKANWKFIDLNEVVKPVLQ